MENRHLESYNVVKFWQRKSKLGIYGWLLSFSVASLLCILPPSNRPIQFSGDAPSCLTLETIEGYQYILTSCVAYNVPEKDLDGQAWCLVDAGSQWTCVGLCSKNRIGIIAKTSQLMLRSHAASAAGQPGYRLTSSRVRSACVSHSTCVPCAFVDRPVDCLIITHVASL